MNIALPTLSILILLAPGFFFRRFYYTAEFSREYFKSNFSDLVFAIFTPAILIHILGYCLFIKNNYEIDLYTLAILFGGTDSPEKISEAFSKIYKNCPLIISYMLGVSAIGAISGALCKYIIRKSALDRKFRLFRFRNEWHYLFSGEILDFLNVAGKSEDVDLVRIDALAELSDGTAIYSGLLSDYVLSKDGGIDRIYLRDTKRRFINNDNTDKQYYQMEGQFFILPFNQILNLHVTYYALQVEEGMEDEIQSVEID